MLIGEVLRTQDRDDHHQRRSGTASPDGNRIGYDASPIAPKTALSQPQPARASTIGRSPAGPTRPGGADLKRRSGQSRNRSKPDTSATWPFRGGSGKRSAGPRRFIRLPIPDRRVFADVPWNRAEILPLTRELGIGITAYGSESRGRSAATGARTVNGPERFQGSATPLPGRKPATQPRVDRTAAGDRQRLKATVAQAAIAWVLSRGEDIVPATVPVDGTGWPKYSRRSI